MNNTYNFKETEEKIQYLELFKKTMDKAPEISKEDGPAVVSNQIDRLLYQTEFSFLLNELIFETRFIIKHFEDVPELIKEFHNSLQKSMYTRKFVIVEDNLQEVEIGYLETKRKELLGSPQFEHLKKFLENSSQ